MPKPRMFYFWPTYLCNHNCIGCDWSDLNKVKHIINSDAWKEVFKEMSSLNTIRHIEFCGGGEPLLHPDIHEMIKKSAEHGWLIGMLTNGTMLKGRLLRDMIMSSAYIRISMESGSEEVFNRIKRPQTKDAGFNAVISNIKEAVRLSRLLNPNCNIGYKFTVGKENYQDMENAVIVASSIGCSSIQFKAYRNTESELREIIRIELDKEIQRLREKYRTIDIIGSLTETQMTTQCFMSPIHVLIDCFGDCYLCCYFRHRRGSHYIGNILRDGFKGMWYSKKHSDVIKNINKRECELYDCKFFTYNKLMDDFMVKTRELDIV